MFFVVCVCVARVLLALSFLVCVARCGCACSFLTLVARVFFTLLVRIKATTLISLLGLLENVCVFAFVVCVRACDHNFFPCVLTVVHIHAV